MSDDESFVILGSSPLPSLQEDTQKLNNFDSLKIDEFVNANGYKNVETTQDLERSISASLKSNSSVEATSQKSLKMASSVESQKIPVADSIGAANASLATSFIMGELNVDELKSSVYSQLPSLCSMEACAEDVVKLQCIMSEYIELKNTLAKVNATMKQFYKKTQQWKDDMQRMEQNYKKQLDDCQFQIVSLRNENLDLKRDINAKIEQVNVSEYLRKKDYDELIQCVSEKTAQINNMCTQIQKLEEQQLASYEYLPKNEHDSKEKPDYVDRLEHERVVKEFERKMSEIVAENLDLKDVQKQFVDEINCLKVNLCSAEELLHQTRAERPAYETERDEMREEMKLLRQQVEIYSKDFEVERTARQNIAGEKDNLLQDLRVLQRKNQELIEQAQKYWENFEREANKIKGQSPAPSVVSADTSIAAFEVTNKQQRPIRPLPAASSSPSTSSPRASPPSTSSPRATPPRISEGHRCPLCYKTFKALNLLECHVDLCLEGR